MHRRKRVALIAYAQIRAPLHILTVCVYVYAHIREGKLSGFPRVRDPYYTKRKTKSIRGGGDFAPLINPGAWCVAIARRTGARGVWMHRRNKLVCTIGVCAYTPIQSNINEPTWF